MSARIITGMSADEYHSDPLPTPSLSSSIAHTLVSRSPLHAWSQHPRLGGVPREPTKSLDRGSLSHALMLGAGKELAILDFDDFRTKAAREARDAARAEGLLPVLLKDLDAAEAVAIELRKRFAEYGVALDGQKEIVVTWSETADDGSEVLCRGMMDHVAIPIIDDLKSCRSAHPLACQRHVDGYGYAIQHAAYVSAIEKLHPELAGRVSMRFVFYELEPPFAVTPVRLSGAFRELGHRRWRRAINAWARCLREARWPAYVDGWTELEPPPWALSQDVAEQMDDRDNDWKETAQ